MRTHPAHPLVTTKVDLLALYACDRCGRPVFYNEETERWNHYTGSNTIPFRMRELRLEMRNNETQPVNTTELIPKIDGSYRYVL